MHSTYHDRVKCFHKEHRSYSWELAPIRLTRYPCGDATIFVDGTLLPYQLLYIQGGTFPVDLIAEYTSIMYGLHTTLFLPYLPGARGDHDIPNDAYIHADLIASFKFNELITVDPHSPAWGERYQQHNLTFTTYPVLPLITRAIADIPNIAGIIAPDAGATTRATHVAQATNLPLFQGLKHRNSTNGQLSGFTCQPLPNGGVYLVVDDICDGGATFNGLASVILENHDVSLHLWVTHGCFTGGTRTVENLENYAWVYTTNSHQGAEKYEQLDENLTIYPLPITDL